MVQNNFEWTILMNNNDYTSNDSRRVAVEDWDVSDAVPNIVLEDISKKWGWWRSKYRYYGSYSINGC